MTKLYSDVRTFATVGFGLGPIYFALCGMAGALAAHVYNVIVIMPQG